MEQARQQVALARAQLDGAHASTRLAQTGAGLNSITAPFPGVVTRAPTGIGSVVNQGVPLVHIEDTSRFRLSATVGEEDVPLVSVGASVTIALSGARGRRQGDRDRALPRSGDPPCTGRD